MTLGVNASRLDSLYKRPAQNLEGVNAALPTPSNPPVASMSEANPSTESSTFSRFISESQHASLGITTSPKLGEVDALGHSLNASDAHASPLKPIVVLTESLAELNEDTEKIQKKMLYLKTLIDRFSATDDSGNSSMDNSTSQVIEADKKSEILQFLYKGLRREVQSNFVDLAKSACLASSAGLTLGTEESFLMLLPLTLSKMTHAQKKIDSLNQQRLQGLKASRDEAFINTRCLKLKFNNLSTLSDRVFTNRSNDSIDPTLKKFLAYREVFLKQKLRHRSISLSLSVLDSIFYGATTALALGGLHVPLNLASFVVKPMGQFYRLYALNRYKRDENNTALYDLEKNSFKKSKISDAIQETLKDICLGPKHNNQLRRWDLFNGENCRSRSKKVRLLGGVSLGAMAGLTATLIQATSFAIRLPADMLCLFPQFVLVQKENDFEALSRFRGKSNKAFKMPTGTWAKRIATVRKWGGLRPLTDRMDTFAGSLKRTDVGTFRHKNVFNEEDLQSLWLNAYKQANHDEETVLQKMFCHDYGLYNPDDSPNLGLAEMFLKGLDVDGNQRISDDQGNPTSPPLLKLIKFRIGRKNLGIFEENFRDWQNKECIAATASSYQPPTIDT